MANWCSNNIFFEGEEKNIDALYKLFEDLIEKYKATDEGQRPDFLEDGRYMFYFYLGIENKEPDNFSMMYETKWADNVDDMVQIAEKYKVDFEYYYEELGCGVYGRAIYRNGKLDNVYLENEDFDQFEYDDEKEVYMFREEEYDSNGEILETLLEEKIAKGMEQ